MPPRRFTSSRKKSASTSASAKKKQSSSQQLRKGKKSATTNDDDAADAEDETMKEEEEENNNSRSSNIEPGESSPPAAIESSANTTIVPSESSGSVNTTVAAAAAAPMTISSVPIITSITAETDIIGALLSAQQIQIAAATTAVPAAATPPPSACYRSTLCYYSTTANMMVPMSEIRLYQHDDTTGELCSACPTMDDPSAPTAGWNPSHPYHSHASSAFQHVLQPTPSLETTNDAAVAPLASSPSPPSPRRMPSLCVWCEVSVSDFSSDTSAEIPHAPTYWCMSPEKETTVLPYNASTTISVQLGNQQFLSLLQHLYTSQRVALVHFDGDERTTAVQQCGLLIPCSSTTACIKLLTIPHPPSTSSASVYTQILSQLHNKFLAHQELLNSAMKGYHYDNQKAATQPVAVDSNEMTEDSCQKLYEALLGSIKSPTDDDPEVDEPNNVRSGSTTDEIMRNADFPSPSSISRAATAVVPILPPPLTPCAVTIDYAPALTEALADANALPVAASLVESPPTLTILLTSTLPASYSHFLTTSALEPKDLIEFFRTAERNMESVWRTERDAWMRERKVDEDVEMTAESSESRPPTLHHPSDTSFHLFLSRHFTISSSYMKPYSTPSDQKLFTKEFAKLKTDAKKRLLTMQLLLRVKYAIPYAVAMTTNFPPASADLQSSTPAITLIQQECTDLIKLMKFGVDKPEFVNNMLVMTEEECHRINPGDRRLYMPSLTVLRDICIEYDCPTSQNRADTILKRWGGGSENATSHHTLIRAASEPDLHHHATSSASAATSTVIAAPTKSGSIMNLLRHVSEPAVATTTDTSSSSALAPVRLTRARSLIEAISDPASTTIAAAAAASATASSSRAPAPSVSTSADAIATSSSATGKPVHIRVPSNSLLSRTGSTLPPSSVLLNTIPSVTHRKHVNSRQCASFVHHSSKRIEVPTLVKVVKKKKPVVGKSPRKSPIKKGTRSTPKKSPRKSSPQEAIRKSPRQTTAIVAATVGIIKTTTNVPAVSGRITKSPSKRRTGGSGGSRGSSESSKPVSLLSPSKPRSSPRRPIPASGASSSSAVLATMTPRRALLRSKQQQLDIIIAETPSKPTPMRNTRSSTAAASAASGGAGSVHSGIVAASVVPTSVKKRAAKRLFEEEEPSSQVTDGRQLPTLPQLASPTKKQRSTRALAFGTPAKAATSKQTINIPASTPFRVVVAPPLALPSAADQIVSVSPPAPSTYSSVADGFSPHDGGGSVCIAATPPSTNASHRSSSAPSSAASLYPPETIRKEMQLGTSTTPITIVTAPGVEEIGKTNVSGRKRKLGFDNNSSLARSVSAGSASTSTVIAVISSTSAAVITHEDESSLKKTRYLPPIHQQQLLPVPASSFSHHRALSRVSETTREHEDESVDALLTDTQKLSEQSENYSQTQPLDVTQVMDDYDDGDVDMVPTSSAALTRTPTKPKSSVSFSLATRKSPRTKKSPAKLMNVETSNNSSGSSAIAAVGGKRVAANPQLTVPPTTLTTRITRNSPLKSTFAALGRAPMLTKKAVQKI